jgi:hypothetical protein
MEEKSFDQVMEEILACMARELQFKEERLAKQQAEFERNEQYIGSRQSPSTVGYNGQGNKQ